MREAIGGTWLFNIVIFFVILFTGYMSLSINHTKAFNVKDDIVKDIERHSGFSDIANISSSDDKKLIQEIVDSLKKVGYRASSSCPAKESGSTSEWYGFDREGNKTSSNPSFCIREVYANKGSATLPKTVYYQVVVFYQLDLPIFNSLFGFKVKGDTRLIYS